MLSSSRSIDYWEFSFGVEGQTIYTNPSETFRQFENGFEIRSGKHIEDMMISGRVKSSESFETGTFEAEITTTHNCRYQLFLVTDTSKISVFDFFQGDKNIVWNRNFLYLNASIQNGKIVSQSSPIHLNSSSGKFYLEFSISSSRCFNAKMTVNNIKYYPEGMLGGPVEILPAILFKTVEIISDIRSGEEYNFYTALTGAILLIILIVFVIYFFKKGFSRN